ncbi:MAG: hypothetical protein J6T67_10270 [Paludibacteraceae bacterium]|nr:hypothetical protein [Paludibacteraceae bacterium]
MSNSTRIAKNTLLLYVRMFFIMLVTLYTSRVILEVLGVEDFGIYNVVGGVSSSFVFFSSALSNSTQRFLNFKMGENDMAGAKAVFNNSFLIYSAFSAVVLLIGIPLGYWFVTHKLVIPEARMDAAIGVFFVTVFMFVATMLLSVYDSVLIARENMKCYAFVGVFDAVSKLAIVYALMLTDGDRLMLYAILLCVVHLISKAIPAIVCIRKYEECKLDLRYDKALVRQLFGFIGWNGFGCAVWMINGQGINILINTFFGTVVNAANGIATQVTQAVNNFSVNFFTAVRPQIVKSFAAKDYEYFNKLVYASCRFSFYMTWMVCLPLMAKSDYILQLWLGNPPDYASEFVIWSLLFSAINVLTNPVWCAAQASGRIAKFIMVGSTVFLMVFPISWVMLSFGHEPTVVFQVMCVMRVAYLITITRVLGGYIDFPLSRFLKNVLLPVVKVGGGSAVAVYFLAGYFPDNIYGLIIFTLLTILITGTLSYVIGMNGRERQMIKDKAMGILKKAKR